MKSTHTDKNSLCRAWFIYKKKTKGVLLSTLIITGVTIPTMAQNTEDSQTKPSWWFGAAAGANFNFYQGSTQELNADFTPPVAFHDGFGVGLFLAPTIEYYRPNTRLGMILQFGYDGRKGKFDQVLTPCDCPQDLSAKLNYITIEPSLRFAPFRNNFYMFAGPRFAYNLDKSFVYQLSINPAYPDQTPSPEVTGDFSNVEQLLVSMQIGTGVDIPISSQDNRTQFVLSPFVSFHPYFGQDPRSIETWNVTTLRAGASLKFGVAKKSSGKDPKDDDVVIVPVKEKEVVPKIEFIVISPKNIPAERTVKETFPLRNYVFFDLGSTDIPKRYVKLEKSKVKEFKEDQVELFTPENLSGRSKRQLVVYYNILNILGDRMGENPNSTIKLVGSSELSAADGRKMAESIKTYLVDVFSIAPSRITTEGLDSPKIPSRQVGGTEELALLSEGDRRVSIESNSPALLMEFQSGPSAPLKPVNVLVVEEAPIDSYVSFENKNAKENFTSWIIEVKDDNGTVQTFGPYTEDKVTIPGKDILGTNAEGNYKVKMIGTTKAGKKHEKETDVQMVLWVPAKTEVAMRFSVIYEFNESKAIGIYDKYLTEIVVNKIPKNGKVIIHGHTDIIGDPQYNEKLSLQRANDVKKIMESALAKQGRTDVTFEVMGFGEDQKLSPFENKYPEERFYNRTVLIDIIPEK
ncbi:MAG: OmpA family protein [Flavobacteriales bacterium]